MKPNGTLSSFRPIKKLPKEHHIEPAEDRWEEVGDEHAATSVETPIKPDAFNKSDEEKIAEIEDHFRQIMDILGLDLNDDSLKGTPHRVAKMYVQEVFRGLNPENKPQARLFENKFRYQEMLVEKNITLYSHCEHHFVPIIGKAHVGYISRGKVIGLSKINRIVQYFAQRPQVQERLNKQIGEELCQVLETPDVAVIIEADHLCVASRGIQDVNSGTVTSYYNGLFLEEEKRKEFFAYVYR